MTIAHRYVDEEKTTLKRLLKIEQNYRADKDRLKHIDGIRHQIEMCLNSSLGLDSLEDLRDFFALQCLQSVLSYRTDKQIVYTFSVSLNCNKFLWFNMLIGHYYS